MAIAPIAAPSARASPTCRKVWAKPLSGPQRPREHRLFRPPVRAVARTNGLGASPNFWTHRAAAVRRPAGEEAVRRHAAEARALLLADPRSRPPDPGRADDRRRSAVPPAVLGTDRPMRAAPAGDERVVATAYMEEAERFDWLVAMNAGRVLATGAPADSRRRPDRHARGGLHRAAAGGSSARGHGRSNIPPRQRRTRRAGRSWPAI